MARPGRSALYSGVARVGPVAVPSETELARFDRFHALVEPRLRRALVAAFGSDTGREATAEALAWAWEHRDRLEAIDRPVPYLYRVGASRVRRRRVPLVAARLEWADPWCEPALAAGLRDLTQRQRVAVVLVHAYAWTHAEVGEVLGLRPSTVSTHLERGLARLRRHLEVDVAEERT